jgi:uncharacterized membrane protein
MLHLIHPALVHFSVAFVVAGGATELFGLLAPHEAARRWGGTLALVGLASLVPTIASGYLAANTASVPAAAEELLAAHERNGWMLLGLLFASQFWKAWTGGRLAGWTRWVYVVALTGAVLLAIWGAWLGGRLVYAHGVGVTLA